MNVRVDADELLVATAVATAIATSISLLASLWWRRVDRKEADWITFNPTSIWGGPAGMVHQDPNVTCTLANVGDASAFRVRLVGFGCYPRLHAQGDHAGRPTHSEMIPSLAPGAEQRMTVWCTPETWDTAFVIVQWIASPTRRRWRSRRSMVMPLATISSAPSYFAEVSGPMNEATGSIPVIRNTTPPEGWSMPVALGPERPVPGSGNQWNRWFAARSVRRLAKT